MSKDSPTVPSSADKNQEIDNMMDLSPSPDINMHTTTTNIGAGGEQQLMENGNGDLCMEDDDSDDKNWKASMDEIEDGIGNEEAKTRWDRIEPSPTNLNKLDGWLKKGHSNREDDYHAPVDFNDRAGNEGKKPRVRWLDVETHLQNLDLTNKPINHHRRESTN